MINNPRNCPRSLTQLTTGRLPEDVQMIWFCVELDRPAVAHGGLADRPCREVCFRREVSQEGFFTRYVRRVLDVRNIAWLTGVTTTTERHHDCSPL
jgi:hypothetical protein